MNGVIIEFRLPTLSSLRTHSLGSHNYLSRKLNQVTEELRAQEELASGLCSQARFILEHGAPTPQGTCYIVHKSLLIALIRASKLDGWALLPSRKTTL